MMTIHDDYTDFTLYIVHSIVEYEQKRHFTIGGNLSTLFTSCETWPQPNIHLRGSHLNSEN